MASNKKYSTFDKQNRSKKKSIAPAIARTKPSKSMTAAVPRTKKSVERMAAEKAARKIVVNNLKRGTSYDAMRKKYEVLAGRMTTERNRASTRAKATTNREAAKQKIQKLNRKKAVNNK